MRTKYATMTAPSEDDCPVSADEALARLMEGNARFLRGEPRFTRALTEVLADLVKGQRPFATILCCSDLRVPPELIFDAKIGDLFVVRVAGNVMSPEIGGSLQDAGTHLKTQLFMVLGHEGCGAVQAALAAKFQGVQERSRIQLLLENILPGLDEVEPQLPPQQKLERAVESNVRWSMRQILETPEGRARMAEGRMKLVERCARSRLGECGCLRSAHYAPGHCCSFFASARRRGDRNQSYCLLQCMSLKLAHRVVPPRRAIMSGLGGSPDVGRRLDPIATDAIDPTRTLTGQICRAAQRGFPGAVW